ncbi:polysaccharide deacetylase family protein [Arthrobacter sp. HY1533]|uniref:polysaccharide deacetylase family protein n=1 Tax=Arthrobacter sp. HY1533 TaxID=2970919 RepID=UPI0022B9F03D|nr:polysaccharide deacetylase family protein [Arthrobacter sp. HY1533]
MHQPRRLGRWVGPLVTVLAVALVATGIWWFTSTLPDNGGTANPPATAPSSAAASVTPSGVSTEGPTASATASPSDVPASSAPSTAPATNPATGRVDTLGGLVPDYVLPPIVDGLAPVLTKVPTEQKVVFLTIDDGAVKRDSDLALLEANGIKASLFLANNFVAGDPRFYKKYTAAGHLIENHTMSHNLGFINLSYEDQKAEICGMADFEEQQYGRRPVFFRPPGGPYTLATRQAVAACGLKAIVDWETKANAGNMDYQVGAGLRPGDIVLMHFRPEFPQDLAAFMAAQKAAGLKVVLLEDYLATK